MTDPRKVYILLEHDAASIEYPVNVAGVYATPELRTAAAFKRAAELAELTDRTIYNYATCSCGRVITLVGDDWRDETGSDIHHDNEPHGPADEHYDPTDWGIEFIEEEAEVQS